MTQYSNALTWGTFPTCQSLLWHVGNVPHGLNKCWYILLLLAIGCSRVDPVPNEKPSGEKPSASPPPSAEVHQPANSEPDVSTEAVAREPRPEDWFADVTQESGITFRYRNGREAGQFSLLETVGGGVGVLDYDCDGDLDLFFCGGGTFNSANPQAVQGWPSALYRNDGNWRFVDVTAGVGLDVAGDYSHGVAVADFDRNGYPDLFVTAYGQSRLYKNEKGSFRDVTLEAGLQGGTWSTAAAWADIDRNRFPDLYVANYVDWHPNPAEFCGDRERGIRDVCPPQKYPGTPDRLFRNRGDGTFVDASAEVGLRPDGRGLGVVACDLNQDARVDFYVANDAGDNFLYCGGPNLPFSETGLLAGVANEEYGLAEGSMGVDAGDYNGDGLADLFVTNFEMENNSLYRGDGGGSFTHSTLATGLRGSCFPFVGFGTGFVDFDSDGWQDLFACNGNVFYHLGYRGYYQPAFLFRNEGGKRFADVTEQGGPFWSVPHVGRGAAAADLDNDGATDLVIVHQNDPVTVLRNQRVPSHWLRVQLEGVHCDREAVGAEVSIQRGGRRLTRWVRSGAGYLSQFDQRIVFPLESATPTSVTVRWPTGLIEVFPACEPRMNHLLVEGHGQAKTETNPD